MSETPDTPAAAAEASQPAARKVKRPWMTWIKLFLLFLIVVCLNYVGCHEYYRRDLTEDQRYEISRQSINMLQSPEIQKRKTPVFHVEQAVPQVPDLPQRAVSGMPDVQIG